MTDNIQIDTGEKRITVNGDLNRVISFNPYDVTFAERFYNLIGEFERKLKDFEQRSKLMEVGDNTLDEHGIPANTGEKLALMHEAVTFLRDEIDKLFGENTSQIVFGNAMELEMFAQFFTGITPYVKRARKSKVDKYVEPDIIHKRNRHKVK